MEIEVDDPPKKIVITLTGSGDIASLKYLLENVSGEAKQTTMWTIGHAILERLES